MLPCCLQVRPLRLLWLKYCTHPILIYKHVRVCTIIIDIYDEFPLCLIVAHTLPNRHEQFAIEMFCQWSSVSTISRTTLWQRYDKERLSIHCRKASCKTKHFARYVPSVWLEGHSFFMSYWLSMSVLTIPTLINFCFIAIEAYHFKCI